MPVQDRIRRYKTTGGGAGLVRVEVLVPAADRDAILTRAAELRARHRAAPDLPPNREAVNDRAKLILHRLIARMLRHDSGLLEEARARAAAAPEPLPDHAQDWQALLRQNPQDVARAIISRSEHMTRLRTASPFRLPQGYELPDWRRRVWRKARLGMQG